MDKKIYDILKTLEEYGYKAYIVGGFVRDSLLHKKNYDVDITTSATVKEMSLILNGKITSTYGSFKMNVEPFNIDITTFRKEISYKGRYPEVLYIDNEEDDVKRRDFTINSILMDKEGHLIDYLGGIKDLSKRIIRCIGNSDDRFREDPLRILRALRFSATLDFKMDNDTVSAVKKEKGELHNLSLSLVRREFDKILMSNNPKKALDYMNKIGILKELNISYKKLRNTSDYLGMYAQMDMPDNYPFTKQEKHTIKELNNIIKYGKIDNIILYEKGLYYSSLAGEILGIKRKKVVDMDTNLPIHSKKDINITIEELLMLGIKKNNLNEVLNLIEKEILKKKIKNNKEDIIRLVSRSAYGRDKYIKK